MRPGNHVLDGGPDPPMGSGKFLGENGRSIVKYRDNGRLCKDGCTDRDAVWVLGSDGP